MRRTLRWVLYILMGVQIALGCAWFVCNFGVEQQFRENLDSFLPMEAVSLIQLGFAALSTWYVLGKLGFRGNKYLRAYVCAFLLTVPFLLQMHASRLVWSAALSSFLWLFGLALETMESGLSGKRAAGLSGAYVLYGVICPDGLWLGGILLLAMLLGTGRPASDKGHEGRRQKIGGRARFVAWILLAAGVILAANRGLDNTFLQARRIYRENTPGMAFLSRFVWPNFSANYYFWTEEVKEVLSEETAAEISQRAEQVAEDFYFPLEEVYGRKKATRLCLEMGMNCLKYRTREIVFEAGRDLGDYFLLPFTIEKNLKGAGVSLTAWNYGRMREHTPILVKYYYRYGSFELPFLLLGSFLLWTFGGTGHMRRILRQRPAGGNYILFTVLLYTVWYTVRSNFPIDYKMALPILFIWYLLSVAGLMEEGQT